MPSPIAHGSTVVFAPQVLGADVPRDLRGVLVWGLLLFASVAPDFDIPINWIIDEGRGMRLHGSYSHSLLLAPIFGVIFMLAMRLVWPEAKGGRVWALGTGFYAVHIVMDLLTMGARGPSLFWPVHPERIASPIGIFVGVEHSEYWRWDRHALTIVTEALFALVLYAIARYTRLLKRGVRADAS